MVLKAVDVTRKFGGLVANNAMNLEIRAGEILALIGPNGAGKSTMFNQISGVDTPTSARSRCWASRWPAPARVASRGWVCRAPSSTCACWAA